MFGVKGVGSVGHGKNNIDKDTFHQKVPLNWHLTIIKPLGCTTSAVWSRMTVLT